MRGTTIVAIVLLAALAGGGYVYLQQRGDGTAADNQPGGGNQRPPTPVETAEVVSDTVVRQVQTIGTLRANEGVVIRPEQGGRIDEILFTEGESVESGVPLFQLESSIYRAELDQAQARLQQAQTNHRRIASLDRQGLGTEQELDNARAELRVAEAAAELAQTRLAKMTITAPFEGIVGLRHVSVGDYVSPGQDLVNLLDVQPLKVDFRIPEVYLADMRPGQAINLTVDALPGDRIQGEVYAIDPQVDINGRSLVLRARIDNADRRLQPGLFARVELVLERRADVLLVPESALVPEGEAQYVFRVDDGVARRVAVRIGVRRGTEVEVIEGLAVGDVVVSAGQMKLRDGAAVTPVDNERHADGEG